METIKNRGISVEWKGITLLELMALSKENDLVVDGDMRMVMFK